MAGLLARVTRAFKKADPSQSVIAAATVRGWEVNEFYTKRQQYSAAQLVARFTGTVKVAASRNAMSVASTPIRVYRQGGSSTAFRTRKSARKDFSSCGRTARKMADTGEDIEEVTDTDHWLVKLLETSNSRQYGFSLIEDTALWLGMCGNAYWWKGTQKPTASLWGLAPQFVHAVPSRENFISDYIYGRGSENERKFAADRVIHFRNPNPLGDPYVGRGDLEACIDEADLSKRFVQFALATIDNGAQPGMILSSENWTTEDQVNKARGEWERVHSGPFKAGRTAILGGKVNAQAWSMSDKEIAFLSSSERVDQVVANCFDMPVAILRLETAALATAKESMPQWQTMATRPRCQRLEDQLNLSLVGESDEGLFVAFDDPVQRDWLTDATAVQGLYTAKIITQNEARKEVGFDAVDGGDEFYVEPVASGDGFGGGGSDAGNGSESDAGKRGGSGDTGGAASGKHGGRDTDAGAGRLRIAATGIILASTLILSPRVAKACCHAPPRSAAKDDISAVHGSELAFETALRMFFRGVTPMMLDAVRDDGSFRIDIPTSEQFGAEFSAQVSRFLRALYDAGASAGLRDIHGHGDPAATMRALTAGSREYLAQYEGKLIQSVSTTLDRSIRGALSDGIEAGDSISGLRDRVQEVMGSATKYGAERIARTESSRAFLSAREQAWDASGVVKGKRWLLSADPCPICQTIAEQQGTRGIGAAFMKLGSTLELIGGGSFTCDYAVMQTPPAHPGCRCSMAAEFYE